MFSFIKNRPPLVVFFLCILTSAITLFCFAFYIKNTESVPDSDKNHDWLTLLKHFNSLIKCLELNGKPPEEISDNDFIETSTVQTLVSINNTDFIKKFTSVKGFLTLDGWHSNCPKGYYNKPSHLHIYFDVPEVAKSNVTEFDACVTIRGPEEYLPKFSEPNCKASTGVDEKKAEVFLSTKLRAESNDFCTKGVLSEINFHPQNKAHFANFLSDKEKSLIYVHLLWTSYFLLFILLIIVTYGILQSEHVFDKYIQKFTPHK
ncbi:uncharacterized protein LOC108911471 [Anoplophora glabripennis]|uniref:uncharacterized protein LOC108911471 n=1 Tax=Anoplophora glabripennis TaxID=217634 RepID=UPI0008751CD7|nr:uncharacterized protein LOC108911471 [Anoplophora glabripennis]